MNKTEVMKELRARGTAQNRKIYANHGFTGNVLGVSYADLDRLAKQIKTDQKLAEQLWATGVHDARVLATKIADPASMTATKLDAWAKSTTSRGDSGALSDLAARAPTAARRVAKWTKSKNEWVSTTGWHTLASLVRDDESIGDDALVGYLERIENEIDAAPNMTRYAMNNALISIGIRNAGLRKLATAAAKRIGTVEVDHGNTSCKTPDAVSYIAKAVAHRAKKKAAKKPARKKKSAARAR
jgi:3-methyladenine DNA glycosylase AlkD